MFRISTRLSLSLLLFCFFASCLPAQRPSGGRGTGGIIDVQVRYADGRPAPRDIHVRLESAEGGAEADLDTMQGGKCPFPRSNTYIYILPTSTLRFNDLL